MELETITSNINILNSSNLITDEDVTFLREHADYFDKRFRTRSLFRSKTEMEAGVLREDEHPTPDSKYWQAIGEQNVHLTELINLDFEAKKLNADMELLLAKIDELKEKLAETDNEIARRKLIARITKKKIEYEQQKFGLTQMNKTAQERMREVKTWEPIIEELHSQLKYGDDNFELHHPERYHLRYQKRAENLTLVDPEARENVVSHNKSFTNYFKNSGSPRLSDKPVPPGLPSSSEVDYSKKEEMDKDDPIAKGYFDRKVRTIRVVSPHRQKGDRNATNYNTMQPPAGFNCELVEPYGYTVADARNYVVQKAIEDGITYIFFVDDDVILPKNALVKMIKWNTDVVGGMYYRKYLPLETVSMHVTPEGYPCSIDDYEIGDVIHDTLVMASGCSLLKVEALKKIEYPWYKTITVNGRPTLTEDTYFCQKLKDVGIDIITDTSIQCIHVDFEHGVFYGHPDIVDIDKNEVKEEYRNYFAI